MRKELTPELKKARLSVHEGLSSSFVCERMSIYQELNLHRSYTIINESAATVDPHPLLYHPHPIGAVPNQSHWQNNHLAQSH